MQLTPARFSSRSLLAFTLLAFVESSAQPKISEDRELKEFDLTGWNCLKHLEGSARTPDAIERNRLKNRSGLDLTTTHVKAMDTTSFLAEVATFDAETRRKRRKDLSRPKKRNSTAAKSNSSS